MYMHQSFAALLVEDNQATRFRHKRPYSIKCKGLSETYLELT